MYRSRCTKRQDDPRFHRYEPAGGEDFGLLDEIRRDKFEWPRKQGEAVVIDGRNLGNRSRKVLHWHELKAKYATQDEWLKQYSLRYSWSKEASRYGMSDHNICRTSGTRR